jgi:hypothetical protein
VGRPEAKVEDHLVAGVQKRHGWCAKMIDKGRRGAPDRECRFSRPYGLTIYVETKARDGKLKNWQVESHTALRQLGYVVLVLWTIEQVDAFFKRYDAGFYD